MIQFFDNNEGDYPSQTLRRAEKQHFMELLKKIPRGRARQHRQRVHLPVNECDRSQEACPAFTCTTQHPQ